MNEQLEQFVKAMNTGGRIFLSGNTVPVVAATGGGFKGKIVYWWTYRNLTSEQKAQKNRAIWQEFVKTIRQTCGEAGIFTSHFLTGLQDSGIPLESYIVRDILKAVDLEKEKIRSHNNLILSRFFSRGPNENIGFNRVFLETAKATGVGYECVSSLQSLENLVKRELKRKSVDLPRPVTETFYQDNAREILQENLHSIGIALSGEAAEIPLEEKIRLMDHLLHPSMWNLSPDQRRSMYTYIIERKSLLSNQESDHTAAIWKAFFSEGLPAHITRENLMEQAFRYILAQDDLEQKLSDVFTRLTETEKQFFRSLLGPSLVRNLSLNELTNTYTFLIANSWKELCQLVKTHPEADWKEAWKIILDQEAPSNLPEENVARALIETAGNILGGPDVLDLRIQSGASFSTLLSIIRKEKQKITQNEVEIALYYRGNDGFQQFWKDFSRSIGRLKTRYSFRTNGESVTITPCQFPDPKKIKDSGGMIKKDSEEGKQMVSLLESVTFSEKQMAQVCLCLSQASDGIICIVSMAFGLQYRGDFQYQCETLTDQQVQITCRTPETEPVQAAMVVMVDTEGKYRFESFDMEIRGEEESTEKV